MATKSRTSNASPKQRADRRALRALGVLGLLGIGAAHLELWLGYYQLIPTIGPLFLFTLIFAWVLALVMIVYPKALIAVVAALFSLATLGGYALALLAPKGIFLFREMSISYAGGVAIASEVVAAVALLAWAGVRLLGGRTTAKATSSVAPGRPAKQTTGRPWTPDTDPGSGGSGDSGSAGSAGRSAAAQDAGGQTRPGGRVGKGLARTFFGHT